MRTLITSILTLSILISIWCFFFYDSRTTIKNMVIDCGTDIMSDIESEQWESANKSITTQYNLWKQYRKKALFFLNSEDINEIDCTFARTAFYIKSQDLSNSTGELCALMTQLDFLIEKENITPQNIL